jgi:hypothetical protein
MACCVVIAAMIAAALAIRHGLLGRKARDKDISPLTWRLRTRDQSR